MTMRGRCRRRTRLAGGALLGAVLALSGCTGTGGGAGGADIGPGVANFPGGDQTLTLLAPDKRPTPGPLRGATVDGGSVDVAEYKGHVVVLNVWGSWCPPCRDEARDVQAASRQLAGDGVKFVGVDVRESGGTAAAQAFQRTYGITYPSLYDQNSDYLLALRGVVAANAIPSTVVLDAQGRVAARFSGKITKTTLVDVVHDVMANRTTTS
jgi:thiol-disulfide isomerase/thioredoxin